MGMLVNGDGIGLRRTTSLPAWNAFTTFFRMRRNGAGGANNDLFFLISTAGSGTYLQAFIEDSTNDFKMYHEGSATTGNSLFAVTNSTWYDVFIVGDGTNVTMWYGTTGGTTALASFSCTNASHTPTGFSLGEVATLGSGYALNFSYDDWKIWNVAMTSAQMEQERYRRLPVRTTDLNSWMPLVDTNIDSAILDRSDNKYSTTKTGSPTAEDGAPVPWGAPTLLTPSVSVYQTVTVFQNSNVGAWLPSGAASGYEAIDETAASDSDFIFTTSNSTARFKLQPLIDPLSSTGHILSYRLRSLVGGNMRVKLYQGGGTTIGAGTLIQTFTHAPAPVDFTTYSTSLGGTETDSISDYTDLYVEFEKY